VTKTLTFLHTSPAHIATFEQLLAELAPDIPVQHLVDVRLLDDARTFGLTPDLTERIARTLDAAGAAVVVCTCSTIGGAAEQAYRADGPAILRIDRPMAERAIAAGSRIIIAATLASTLAPTRQLLLDVARQAGKAVTLIDVLCEGAWAYFERDDQRAYLEAIAGCLRQAAPAGDVIVLAQASMAAATALCPDLGIPILSSPRLGLEAAIQAYRARP
jgi:hypothetical protein